MPNDIQPLETSSALILAPVNLGAVTINKASEKIRNEAVALAAKVTAVTTLDELTSATRALRGVSSLIKAAEADMAQIKRPRRDWLTALGCLVAEFLNPAEAQKDRLTGMINHYQRKKLEEADKRAKAAEREKAKALREKEEAEAQAEKLRAQLARTKAGKGRDNLETALLDAEIAAEEAALDAAGKPEAALAVASPAGLTTRVRLDFELTDPNAFIEAYPEFFRWKADDESFKLDRRRLLDVLNTEAPNRFQWLKFPEEQPIEGIPRPAGCRVFKDVSSHVRR